MGMTMPTRTVTVVNERGLHARPASRLAQMAGRFACDISIRHGDVVANAKSVLGVMTLAAGVGSSLELDANGADAAAALDALADLFARGFDDG
jgi:phosphocarrier protein